MGLFKNLFACFCNNHNETSEITLLKNEIKQIQEEITRLKTVIKNIETDVANLFRVRADAHTELKRLDDKLNTNFSLLSTKIDNVIMILNANHKSR